MPKQTISTKNKRMYPPGIFRARPRSPLLKNKTITDAAYLATRSRFGNHDREYIKLIKKVFADYLELVKEHLCEGLMFKIPMRLGTIIIKKSKGGKIVNWKETKRQKKYIYFNNLESDGYIMKIFWDKFGKALFNNMRYYSFSPARYFQIQLSNAIRYNGNIDYAIHTSKNDTRRLYS